MLKAIIKAKKITGNPVPIEKTIGNNNPSLEANVIGINIAKNKAPLYGQNAIANKAPNKNEPNNPLVLKVSDNFSVKLNPLIKFNLIISNIIKPMIIKI